jgi:hypothetical protein
VLKTGIDLLHDERESQLPEESPAP